MSDRDIKLSYGSMDKKKTKLYRIPISDRKKIGAGLYEISKKKYDVIPLDEMEKVLNKFGIRMVQEDGTPFSAIISLPHEKSTTLDIQLMKDEPVYNAMDEKISDIPHWCFSRLIVGLYKFNSGRIEVNAYLS